MKSRCHLNEYERGPSGERSLVLLFSPPLTLDSSLITFIPSLKLPLYLTFFPPPVALSCHVIFHRPTSLRQSVNAPFFFVPFSPRSHGALSCLRFILLLPLSLSPSIPLPWKRCGANSRGDSARSPSARHRDPLLS